MTLQILGTALDVRTTTPVVYAKASIPTYLDIVGTEFEEFAIQRRREKYKAYERMKNDVTQGALLPTITLAVKPEFVPEIRELLDGDYAELADAFSRSGRVNILDGLQRTYILRDLQTSGITFDVNQTLLLEFWLEERLEHLIYRIIVLNAGQKPMSMRHQVELLFATLRAKIEEQVDGLELFTERDAGRRRGARKYALDKVALAFHSFLTQTPESNRENLIAQQLIETEALDADEQLLNERFADFIRFLRIYAELDDDICRVYTSTDAAGITPTGSNWFGSENVMSAFFAAVAQFTKTGEFRPRVERALDKLKTELSSANIGDDPLALTVLQSLIDGLNPRKVNVGFATRRLLMNGFKEYFRESGARDFTVCWPMAAE